ncbi:hypothetical protein JCM17960_06390 [Magnetospira thiophila]
MLFKKIAAALGGLAALATAACEEAPFQTVVEYRLGGDNFSFFQYATSRGPFWIDLHGNPFGGDLAILEETVIGAFKKGVPQLAGVRFTTDKAQAAQPGQRLVVIFGAPADLTPLRICNGQIPEALGGLGSNGEVHAYTIYCSDEQPRIVVSGKARGVTGPDDQNLKKMLSLTLREMFAPSAL